MLIPNEEIRTFSGFGKVLWMDEDSAGRSLVETLSIVSLLQLTPERAVERASQALLERARRDTKENQVGKKSQALNHPFYRLSAEERLTLVGLHVGRWSYERLSRVLKLSAERVEELAWGARLELAPEGFYPHGPSPKSPDCPAYLPARPWAQRFLDEEMASGRELHSLRVHLMGCVSCSGYLARCRELYFQVGQQVSHFSSDPDAVENLESLIHQNTYLKFPSERSFRESLELFSERRDVQIFILLGIGLSFLGIIKLFKSLL